MSRNGPACRGTVMMGTVQGDMHGIGRTPAARCFAEQDIVSSVSARMCLRTDSWKLRRSIRHTWGGRH